MQTYMGEASASDAAAAAAAAAGDGDGAEQGAPQTAGNTTTAGSTSTSTRGNCGQLLDKDRTQVKKVEALRVQQGTLTEVRGPRLKITRSEDTIYGWTFFENLSTVALLKSYEGVWCWLLL